MKKKDAIEIKADDIDVRHIKDPNIVKRLSYPELSRLAEKIRGEIIDQVSRYGGHLSSNLGDVELTLALYRVFDFAKDKLIFDVGHQCYTHKILTGRVLDHLNQPGYCSGFQKRAESPYDVYEAGHSSTSLSAAEAFAYARDMKGEKYDVVALIGDASMANGLSFEALNDLAIRNSKVIIVLNDNEMSISKPVGGIGRFFRKISTGKAYNDFKRRYRKILSHNRLGAKVYNLSFAIKNIIKRKLVPLTMFDNLGYSYMGPFDGHDVKLLEKNLKRAKNTDKSVVFHVRTIKGKGYRYAENDQTGYWHGATPFDVATGKPKKEHPGLITYSHLFADLTEKALSERKNAVLIVPAMMKGSGQEESFIKHPDRCFDVGIAEEHALTFAGALGINGFHPIVNIYSTFLQRAYDELSHDCARLGSNMTLLIDRAGLVGSNGETHQGIFDPAFLRAMPGVCLSMPSNPQIAARLMDMSFEKGGIFAIRYSRKGLIKDELPTPDGRLAYLGMRTLNQPSSLRLAIVAVGPRSEEIAKSVKEYRIDAAVFDPVFLNPLPNGIVEALSRFDAVLVHDPYGVEAGFALPLVGALALSGYKGKIAVQAVPNEFIQADSIDAQEEKCGVSLSACLRKAAELLGNQSL